MIKEVTLSRHVLLVPLLSLALAACAPALTGSQVSVPVVAATALSPASVVPGSTVYLQYTYPASLLQISDARFDALKINFSDREPNNEVRSPETPAGWLSLRASDLPAGWTVSLQQAYLVKQVSKTENAADGTEVRFRDNVRVIYKVTAPQDASPGSAELQFYDEGKAIGTVPLLLEVKK